MAVVVVAHAVAVVQHTPVFNVIAIVFVVGVLFVHLVLKWLQYLLCVQNVMPWHFASSSHDFLHAARSETVSEDPARKTSPAPMSHMFCCVRLIIEMAFVVSFVSSFSHVVLK